MYWDTRTVVRSAWVVAAKLPRLTSPVAEAPAAAAPAWSVSQENMAVPMLLVSPKVRFCLAFCRASRKFGINRAAMIPMMATTISSSIRVKPRCR